MIDKKIIQKYINNFRRRIGAFLKADIGLHFKVYPAQIGGAILEVTIGPDIENDDSYQDFSPSISDALGKIRQHEFGGDLGGFVFRGTNVLLEKGRIILIKDDSISEWNDDAAKVDVHRVVFPRSQ